MHSAFHTELPTECANPSTNSHVWVHVCPRLFARGRESELASESGAPTRPCSAASPPARGRPPPNRRLRRLRGRRRGRSRSRGQQIAVVWSRGAFSAGIQPPRRKVRQKIIQRIYPWRPWSFDGSNCPGFLRHSPRERLVRLAGPSAARAARRPQRSVGEEAGGLPGLARGSTCGRMRPLK